MAKKCDNTSVGVIVRDEAGRILLIERKVYNPGWALPAGHQDGDSPEEAAKKELQEEVGLIALELRPLITKKLENPCKRDGGSHHQWTVFSVPEWTGTLKPSDREVKDYVWTDAQKIKELANRFETFVAVHHLNKNNFPVIVKTTNESDDWKRNPGLEPPMYILFNELGLI